MAGVLIAQSSETAMTAAAARAAHLIVDREPVIFADTLAGALLGERAEEFVRYHREHGAHPILAGARAQVTCRSRFTEDRLGASGIDQYVILGAGLDSYAYRANAGIAVFEVDHPATQAWKRDALAEAGVAAPETVTFVPLDFESDPLPERLAAAGLDADRPALVSWLGVTMYLTRAAIGTALSALGRLAPGSEVVADYHVPADLRDAAGQQYADGVGPVAAQRGEPWLSEFAPGDLADLLRSAGLEPLADLSQHDALPARLWQRTDALRPVGLSRLVHARVTG